MVLSISLIVKYKRFEIHHLYFILLSKIGGRLTQADLKLTIQMMRALNFWDFAFILGLEVYTFTCGFVYLGYATQSFLNARQAICHLSYLPTLQILNQ